MALGIAGYGCYLPVARLPARELERAWGAAPAGLRCKAVAGVDEDPLTLGLAAASDLDVPPSLLAIAIASMTLPYRRRTQAGLLAHALGFSGANLFVSEHTTSARAGTEALLAQAGYLDAGGTGLVLAAEVASGPAAGGADAAAGAGAVALLLGPAAEVATLEGAAHYVAEDPGLRFSRAGEERWRDVQVPDYSELAYQEAGTGAIRALLARLGRRAADYRFVVLNPPDSRLARGLARSAGCSDEQWQGAWAFPTVGDLGAAGPLFGLAMALDASRPGDRILLLAYGSGSVADALSLTAGPGAGRGRVAAALAGGQEIDYVTYLKLRGEL